MEGEAEDADEAPLDAGRACSEAPEDANDRAYWMCFFLGAGILFPWNAFITAVDYFEKLYPGRHIDRLFGVLYFVPNLATLPVVLRFGHLVSPRARVRFGYSLFLGCQMVPLIRGGGLGLLCLAVVLTGVADAAAQGSLFGVVGPMPEKYTQALMGGTSFSVRAEGRLSPPSVCLPSFLPSRQTLLTEVLTPRDVSSHKRS